MSGPFDPDYTDEAEFSPVGNQIGFEELKDLNVSDILNMLEEDHNLPDLENPLSVDNKDLFLEVFADLSDFNFNGESGDLTSTPNMVEDVGTVALAAEEECKGTKRPASETLAPLPNPDHNDYIIKRPRLSISEESSTSEAYPHVDKTRDPKYLERRRKNNVASRRSREIRKQKIKDMDQQADDLESKNAKLVKHIEELEQLTTQMKEILVKRLATGTM